MDLVVLAKVPIAGRVKTRLCPPCSPRQAAQLAQAALIDTLRAARASTADRVILALDGPPGSWLPPDVAVVDQGHGTLAERLAHVWSQVSGPALQVGMDTPQVTPEVLDRAMELLRRRADAVLGPAADGGWWAIGMRHPDPSVFAGVPTSQGDTGVRQLARLRARFTRTVELRTMCDVDTFADARRVARAVPHTSFGATLLALEPVLGAA